MVGVQRDTRAAAVDNANIGHDKPAHVPVRQHGLQFLTEGNRAQKSEVRVPMPFDHAVADRAGYDARRLVRGPEGQVSSVRPFQNHDLMVVVALAHGQPGVRSCVRPRPGPRTLLAGLFTVPCGLDQDLCEQRFRVYPACLDDADNADAKSNPDRRAQQLPGQGGTQLH
jgi:hypothetical protein